MEEVQTEDIISTSLYARSGARDCIVKALNKAHCRTGEALAGMEQLMVELVARELRQPDHEACRWLAARFESQAAKRAVETRIIL